MFALLLVLATVQLDSKTRFYLYLLEKGAKPELPEKFIVIKRVRIPSLIGKGEDDFFVWDTIDFGNVGKCKECVVVRFPRKLKIHTLHPPLPASHPLSLSPYEEVRARVAKESFRVKGKGVLVGIVDSGVTWSLSALSGVKRDMKGTRKSSSKVIRIWTQPERGDFDYPEGFTYPDGFTFGWECKSPSPERDCPSFDSLGHGTHVAGIISASAPKFEGIAPDSLLLAVKTNFWEYEALEGIRYIVENAKRFGLPVVVNLSLGGHFGPHDGTGFFERQVASFVDEGVIIVAAAGNEGDPLATPIHVGAFISASAKATVRVYDECDVEFWMTGNPTVKVAVWANGVSNFRTLFLNEPVIIEIDRGAILLEYVEGQKYFNRWARTNTDKKLLFISTYGYSGKIEVVFEPDGVLRVDGWVVNPTGCKFEDEGELVPNDEMTVSVPATHPDVLAVCSYSEQDGKLSNFSSKGADWLGYTKPDVCAPGESIPSLCTDEGKICYLTGTSQSSPFLAGAIALALSRNPSLTVSDIRKALREGSARDKNTGRTPNRFWGYGKLRIDEFLANIPPRSRPSPPDYNIAVIIDQQTPDMYRVEFITDFPTSLSSGAFWDSAYSEHHVLYLPDKAREIQLFDFAGGQRSFVIDPKSGYVEKGEGFDGGDINVQIRQRISGGIACTCSSASSGAELLPAFIFLILLRFRKPQTQSHP